MGIVVDFCQKTMQNKHAQMPFIVPVAVLSNTPTEIIEANIRANAALDLPWLSLRTAHSGVAILCGGGPSIEGDLDTIRALQAAGGTIFAMNGTSQFLRSHGIEADHQMLVDAKPETAHLVDPFAKSNWIASQCQPATVARGNNVTLWHVYASNIESMFPPERVRSGGYVLTSGGISVGNCALTVVFGQGFRAIHCFGYDSSHRDDDTHAYSQPMNRFIPTVEVEWAGLTYTCSVAMKAQAEKFHLVAQQLQRMGCTIEVHGSGLLPAMWNTPEENLTERDKYRLMWRLDTYRESSPGERCIPEFLSVVKPDGLIADFGCGTGRAALALAKAGHLVTLIDFASNCRDPEVLLLPFLEWDLTKHCPVSAPYGICCDVMEHIPPKDVETVIKTVMRSAETVFFQISTINDVMGAIIGQPLHLSVHSAEWWRDLFLSLGFGVSWSAHDSISCRFVVTRTPSDGKEIR
jgi:hypothetical protein